ncbi:MAG: 1-acyl-sn-glycerol-3-phosphate acyltransferase [Azoarcus sp.]|jgi:1-acyl-sn-glycerol-3-phosphate acyltransferase|nr:1-acyl-sn-glycerol-3-phosphate acyltransferase [Azoarcus sp.]
MTAGLGRPYRIIATGFCFGVFGLLGLFILCVIVPLASFVWPKTPASRQRVRNILQGGMRWFTQLMVVCGVISLEVRHKERLARNGLLIVANHPSLIDVVLLIGLLRRPNCVVKASLKTNLFTRGPVKCGGFIVNSDGPQFVEDSIASVRAGDSLVIFPEGTRSITHDGVLSPMKRGAANIALRGNIDLTPVVITVSEPALGKGLAWYRAPVRRPHFVLDVKDEISVAAYAGDAPSVAARTLTRDLDAFLTQDILQRISRVSPESGDSPAKCA